MSHARLSSFDNLVLSHLASPDRPILGYSSFRYIPLLARLMCSDHTRDVLSESDRLQKLERLDAHSNNPA